MGWPSVGEIVSKAKSFVEDLLPSSPLISGSNIYDQAEKLKLFTENSGQPWSYVGQDWYKTFPYAFVVRLFDKPVGTNEKEPPPKAQFTFTLPIPPQSFMMKMVTASQATATFGGVVEETSDNVFWIIQMAGTTGVAVSNSKVAKDGKSDRLNPADTFRKRMETTGLLSGVSAQANNLIAKVAGTVDAFSTGGGGIGGVVGALNNAILPQQLFSDSAVNADTNGYTEIHELHRFLYTFSHLKAKRPKEFVLKFQHHKFGQEWNIVVQDFTIQQNAAKPNSYNYSIVLKAWGVKNLGDARRAEVDRFAPGGDLGSVNTVGISGAVKAFKGFKATLTGKSKNTVTDSFLKPFGV